jgi:GNAT superfamily N-acetyltransferase
MAKKKKAPAPATAEPHKTTVTVKCPRHDSFRVQQVAGMFDLQLPAEIVEQFAVEIPTREELIDGRPWQIGCIVGPSGSGKSTVARQAFGQDLYNGRDWPVDRAVVDCFDLPSGRCICEFEPPHHVEDPNCPVHGEPKNHRSIRDITGMLTAVGFSSPPSWVKPYHVLSNGEKFRCDLARAILESAPLAPVHAVVRAGTRGEGPGVRGEAGTNLDRLVVFDEFTSVVDRTVAKIGSAAVSKAIRRMPGLRFVAVTCHYDVVEWLQPDWVLDMQSQSLARGSLRRPAIPLDIFQTKSAAVWNLFKKHHYLSHAIQRGGRFYVGCVEGQPACLVVVGNHFGRMKPQPGYRGVRLISRIVTLPDFQGVGIGGALLDQVAQLLAAEGLQARITTSHPAMINRLRHAPGWQVLKFQLGNSSRSLQKAIATGKRRRKDTAMPSASNRYICAAKWIGQPT